MITQSESCITNPWNPAIQLPLCQILVLRRRLHFAHLAQIDKWRRGEHGPNNNILIVAS